MKLFGYLLLLIPYWLVVAFLLNEPNTLANLAALLLLVAYPLLGYRLFLHTHWLNLRYNLILRKAEKSRQELEALESEALSENIQALAADPKTTGPALPEPSCQIWPTPSPQETQHTQAVPASSEDSHLHQND